MSDDRLELEPTHELTIPSSHDSTPLTCRIYRPCTDIHGDASSPVHTQTQQRGIIIAHPYASLGGSFDDPVVMYITQHMLGLGYTVGTLNFRGAYGSRGSTSWTGKPERADYMTFVAFFVYYMSSIAQSMSIEPRLDLILAGYSYGSMIVSQIDDTKSILARFATAADTSREARVITSARQLALPDQIYRSTGPAGVVEPTSVQSRYLLVAPLLPPISSLLSLAVNIPFWKSTTRKSTTAAETTIEQGVLHCNPVLAVYGTSDIFAASTRLDAWAAKIHALNSRFVYRKIDGASHFWFEDGVVETLLGEIERWSSSPP